MIVVVLSEVLVFWALARGSFGCNVVGIKPWNRLLDCLFVAFGVVVPLSVDVTIGSGAASAVPVQMSPIPSIIANGGSGLSGSFVDMPWDIRHWRRPRRSFYSSNEAWCAFLINQGQ